jgi:hypothetical protein
VAILIASVVAYFQYLAEKRRAQALRQVADELGFDFSPTDQELVTRLQSFHLFSQGRSKKLTNVLRGEANGLAVEIFDYRYTTGSGKSSKTWKQTVLCFRLDGPGLPAFSLRPHTFFHRIAEWFGAQNISFEEHPVFSKNYLLRGPDEAAVRNLFDERALTFYEERPGLSTEGGDDRLLFYHPDKRVAPEKVRGFLAEGFQVLQAFRPSGEAANDEAEQPQGES